MVQEVVADLSAGTTRASSPQGPQHGGGFPAVGRATGKGDDRLSWWHCRRVLRQPVPDASAFDLPGGGRLCRAAAPRAACNDGCVALGQAVTAAARPGSEKVAGEIAQRSAANGVIQFT